MVNNKSRKHSCRGKYAKKIVPNRWLATSTATSQAETSETQNSQSSSRIINLEKLASVISQVSVHAATCQECIDLAHTQGNAISLVGEEYRNGLASVLSARCNGCNLEISLPTSSKVYGGYKRWECNLAVVWGEMITGGGFNPLRESMSALGIPIMTKKSFIETERSLGKWWWEMLEATMKAAGEEEKQLAIDRGDYHQDVPAITVIVDGGWSKRTHKHSYNTKSGVAIIIGKQTQKILFMGVRNKYCSTCARAERKEETPCTHDCYKNWNGSSSAMETDIILEGFQKSESQHGVRYLRFIGDGDSSVYADLVAKVRVWGYAIQKVECANHATKCYRSSLEKLVQDNSTYKGKGKLTEGMRKRLTKAVRCAITMRSREPNKRLTVQLLRRDLQNSPLHCFGIHTKCSTDFCKVAQQSKGVSETASPLSLTTSVLQSSSLPITSTTPSSSSSPITSVLPSSTPPSSRSPPTTSGLPSSIPPSLPPTTSVLQSSTPPSRSPPTTSVLQSSTPPSSPPSSPPTTSVLPSSTPPIISIVPLFTPPSSGPPTSYMYLPYTTPLSSRPQTTSVPPLSTPPITSLSLSSISPLTSVPLSSITSQVSASPTTSAPPSFTSPSVSASSALISASPSYESHTTAEPSLISPTDIEIICSEQEQAWRDAMDDTNLDSVRFGTEVNPHVDNRMLWDIQRLLARLIAKADQLLGNSTTNLCESWMHIRSKFDGGKQINRIQSGSWEDRCAGAGLRQNLGPAWGPTVWESITGMEANDTFRQVSDTLEKEANKSRERKSTIQAKTIRNLGKRQSTDNTQQSRRSYSRYDGGENAADINTDIPSSYLRENMLKYYKSNVVTNKTKAEEIEVLTREQGSEESSRNIWLAERRKRITGSNVGRIVKRRPSTKVANSVKQLLYSTFRGTAATRWGNLQEPVSCSRYIQFRKSQFPSISVKPSGLVINVDHPWLAASPDGVVEVPESTSGIVEFKNPHAARDMVIKEAIEKVKDFCLKLDKEGIVSLTASHQYYYQIQATMFCTKKNWCDFVVCTNKDMHVERIHYSGEFMDKAMPKLRAFYFNAILPELTCPKYQEGGILEPSDWLSDPKEWDNHVSKL